MGSVTFMLLPGIAPCGTVSENEPAGVANDKRSPTLAISGTMTASARVTVFGASTGGAAGSEGGKEAVVFILQSTKPRRTTELPPLR